MTPKRPESVLVVIYDYQHRVLVMQRLDDASFWQSVTGSLEISEAPRDAALREVKEETGIDATADALHLVDLDHWCEYEIRPEWRHRYADGVTVNREHWFSLQVHNGTLITLTEHSDYRWLSISQALEQVWSPSNREAVRRILQP